MLTDDMMLTDNTLGDFDQSLLIVNRIFEDGASVQLHRYDKSTVGNSYLALTRLIRGSMGGGATGLQTGVSSALQYLSPSGYNAFCFQVPGPPPRRAAPETMVAEARTSHTQVSRSIL
jgi:hypothetical protein